MSDEITLYDPASGEVISLHASEASDEALAEVIEATLPRIREQLTDAARIAGEELVARLDRSGKWTRRVGTVGDGVQWEIKAPSPDAGTTEYDLEDLDTAVTRLLLEEGVIDEDGANAAVERTVTVVFRVSSDADAAELVARANRDPLVTGTRTDRKIKAIGVKALEKIPEAAELIATAKRRRDVGPRRPTVKRIEREARKAVSE